MNMSLLSSIILFVLLIDTFGTNLTENVISRTDGIILLLFFAIFMYYTLYEFGEYLRDTREKRYKEQKEKKAKGEKITTTKKQQIFTMKDIKKLIINGIIALISIVMIYAGAELVVNNAVVVAKHFNVSTDYIFGLTNFTSATIPETYNNENIIIVNK